VLHMPLGLLSRAALYRETGNFVLARLDLQEIYDIAEVSGMRLHLTDFHLEMIRLLLVEENLNYVNPHSILSATGLLEMVQIHLDKATELVAATGYNIRLPELEELQNILTGKI